MAYYTAGLIGQYVRDASGTFDISGGNLTITGTLSAGSAAIPTLTPSNLTVPGYIRNALTPTTLDISGGNISNSGTTRSSNVRVTSAGTASAPALVIGNDASSGFYSTTNSLFTTFAGIQTTYFTNNFIEFRNNGSQALWIIDRQLQGASTSLGAVAPTYSFALDTALGLYRVRSNTLGIASGGQNVMTIHSNVGIGTTFPSYTLDVSGTTQSSNILVPGYLRDTLTPTTLDISGGNISNSGTTLSSTFATFNVFTSNNIGGVGLSNYNVINPQGRILTGLGTVSAPAYSFAFDASMGLYRIGANTLGIVSGGENRMTISNSNVGIGTTAPTTVLDISGQGTGFVTAQIRNTAGQAGLQITGSGFTDNSGLQLFHNSTEQAIYNNNRLPLNIWTNNARRLTIDQSGNVGIGTTAPEVPLTFPRTTGTKISLYPNLSNGHLGFGVFSGEFRTSTDNSATAMTWGYNTGSNFTEQMRFVGTSGRLGIGTSAPVTGLDVSASTTFAATFRNPAGSGQINLVASNFPDASGIQLYQSTVGQGLYQSNTLPLSLWTLGSNRMTILSNGNTGIGTTAPLYRLDINGPTTTDVRIASGGVSGGAGGQLNFGIANGIGAANPMAAIKGLLVNFPTIGGTAEEQGSLGFYTRASNASVSQILAERMRILHNGNVGIGTTAPNYRLDVSSDAASNASINMSTWPRMSTTSNILIVRGLSNYVGNSLNWSNETNSMSTSLLTFVASNANGAYFNILRSGIWAINCHYFFGTTGIAAWIDVSTNNVSLVAAYSAGSPVVALVQHSGAVGTLSWTGYLPSNSSYNYKFRTQVTPTINNSNYFQITFLGETPASGSAFPFP